jgi:hypothetical protein
MHTVVLVSYGINIRKGLEIFLSLTFSMHHQSSIAALALFVVGTRAIDIPANIKTFYENAKAQGQCDKPIKSGLYSYYGGPPSELPSAEYLLTLPPFLLYGMPYFFSQLY